MPDVTPTNNGAMKIYPAKEMRAVDMAEVIKALTLFEGVRRVESTDIPVNGGIIQGCQISAPALTPTQLRMTPGRILICGRLADFTPPSGNYFYFTGPVVAETTTCTIVAVCDLSSPANPFYISIVNGSTLSSLDAAANRTSDEDFNRGNGLRYLRLGTVKVAANGVLSEFTRNANSYPVKSNKSYLDGVKNELSNSINANDSYSRDWIGYFKDSRHHSDFFTAYRAIGDGLTVNANSTATFKFRAEYGSKVYIRGTGSDAIPQETWANVFIEPNGTIISQKPDTAIYPSPSLGPNGAPTDIVHNKWKFLGINEIHIENATSGGQYAGGCYIQSYYSAAAPASAGGGSYVCVAIRNTGNATAKIKLTIRSLYVADIG